MLIIDSRRVLQLAAMASQQQQQVPKTIPLRVLVDKQTKKVVFVQTTKHFVETLFSFLSLPLGTIVRLLATNNNNDQHLQIPKSSPFLANIKNLYQTIQYYPNDVWNNPFCKHMLLKPKNPCESLCMKLFLNIDDTQPSTNFYVCVSCNKFTNLLGVKCTCGNTPNIQPRNLDSDEGQGNYAQNWVFVRETAPRFLVSDDLNKIVPSSALTSLEMLIQLGYSDLTQLEEFTHNIAKQEILNLLKYTLTSHEPLTNTILKSSSKNKGNSPTQSASTVRVKPCISERSKKDIRVLQSKSQKRIVVAEANGDFVDYILSFLTMPLGSVVKLLGANSFDGCVGNLYKSVENLDPTSVLLNPGIAPQFGCPNQPLNIPHALTPPTTYYYGPKRKRDHYYCNEERVISRSNESIVNPRVLDSLDPIPLNMSREGVVGFVKRALYEVADNLRLKPGLPYYSLSGLKEMNLPLDDIEVKVISIGEVEALSLLGASLTSKFTLAGGIEDFLNVPQQESTMT